MTIYSLSLFKTYKLQNFIVIRLDFYSMYLQDKTV